ncbi:MAG: carbon-nitrogen hydrolase family protein [Candidatus Berkiellales bacterium]
MTKIAAIQMASATNVDENLKMTAHWVSEAAKQGAECAVLPEEFMTLGLTIAEKRAIAEPFGKGFIQQQLAKIAQDNAIWLIAGTLPIRDQHQEIDQDQDQDQDQDKSRVFSSCLTWDPKGQLRARYDKIHLFDVAVGKGEEYHESELILPGDHIEVLPTPFGKIGMAICYDLRFPELFRALMLKGAEVMVLPSAFTVTTGQVHWETLLKARAIENLCYIVAPGQVGLRANGKKTYGHSMIINPWGEILGRLESEPGILVAEIDLAKLAEIRQRFPALQHTRSFVMASLSENRVKNT